MSLNESIVEDAMRMVKSEIGRVKSLKPDPFLDSLFTIHYSFREAIPEKASPCASHADKGATGKHYLQVQIERRPNP